MAPSGANSTSRKSLRGRCLVRHLPGTTSALLVNHEEGMPRTDRQSSSQLRASLTPSRREPASQRASPLQNISIDRKTPAAYDVKGTAIHRLLKRPTDCVAVIEEKTCRSVFFCYC